MTQTETHPPDPAALQTLAEAIEADGLDDVFDGVNALVRTAIKAKRLRLSPDADLNEYVIDLIADALSDAYQKADRFKPEHRVVPWIIGFARTTLQSRLRDRARQTERDRDPSRFDVHLVGDAIAIDGQPDATDDDLFAVLETTDPEDALDARLDVERALAALDGSVGDGAPDPKNVAHAEILRLYYLDGVSTAELAADYGISENAVDQRRSRARTAARKALGLS